MAVQSDWLRTGNWNDKLQNCYARIILGFDAYLKRCLDVSKLIIILLDQPLVKPNLSLGNIT